MYKRQINTSARHGRKVAITGRSMLNVVSAAMELGYMTAPAGVLIDINEIKKYKPEQLTLVTTGSQGAVSYTHLDIGRCVSRFCSRLHACLSSIAGWCRSKNSAVSISNLQGRTYGSAAVSA